MTLYMPSAAVLAAEEFVAVDFETANRLGGVSACEVAAVLFRNGEVVSTFSSLICPPPGYQYFEFTYLHGISYSDVAAAPSWTDLCFELVDFIGTRPVYAHNARFDAGVWTDLDRYFNTETLPKNFLCTYTAAKRLIKGLKSYSLTSVVAHIKPGFVFMHHKAAADAEACGYIVNHLKQLQI